MILFSGNYRYSLDEKNRLIIPVKFRDILNVEGNPETLGKAVGTDVLRDKSTYPAVLGLEPSKQYARDLLDKALQALEAFDKKADPLRAIAAYIIERKR